jgi:hypothetical protein
MKKTGSYSGSIFEFELSTSPIFKKKVHKAIFKSTGNAKKCVIICGE